MSFFTIHGKIANIAEIAKGNGIDCLKRLRDTHGGSNWRKMKGTADVELDTGRMCRAEVHWYEAHGVGRVEHKIKKLLD